MKHNSEDKRSKKGEPLPAEKPKDAVGNGHKGENGRSVESDPRRPPLEAGRSQSAHQPSALEEAKAKLSAAGLLATDLGIPDDVQAASDEELEQLGRMTPDAPPSEELVNHDRGSY
jgi:hypothetical protein